MRELSAKLKKQVHYNNILKREKAQLKAQLQQVLQDCNQGTDSTVPNSESSIINQYRTKVADTLATYPETYAQQLSLFDNYFDAYVVDLNQPNQQLKFFWKNDRGVKYNSLDRVKTDVQQQSSKLAFVTNGGMYDPNQNPQGLLMQDGEIRQELDRQQSGNGNFYLQPNGVFLIDGNGQPKIVTTQDYLTNNWESRAVQATQSGPMLVINGQYHPKFNLNSPNKNLRSGVGVIDANRVVFIISKLGVNFYDFARLFKEVFGCQNALFLDGVISQMYCPELNRYDTGGSFGTIIGLVK
ncbi:MAG: phosphodiester glycosidase family protein [Bacteroidota bacterium]